MTATPRPGPTTETPGARTADLLDFLDFARCAGLLSQSSAAAYRLGASRILSALPEHAIKDLRALNPDHAIAVFEDECGETVSKVTRRQYAGSFRKALHLFRSYLDEPERWHAKAAEGTAPGWTPASDGGMDLEIPLPRHRSMRLHLPTDITANDARLIRRSVSSYLEALTPAAATSKD